MVAAGQDLESYQLPRPLPLWLNPNYAKHIVKGNFMTLSARPKTVEQGEWIAHQGGCSSFPTKKRETRANHRLQLLSTIEICGILFVSFTRRRRMVSRFATRHPVHACPQACM